jgi:large subunit ribosomal protein L17e
MLILAAKARADDLRAHFKNTYETARAVRGLKIKKAIRYMENVLEHKEVVPYFRFNGHVGRTGQANVFGTQ